MVGHHQCEAALKATRLGPTFKLHEGMLCAGGEQGKDACKVKFYINANYICVRVE